MKKFFEDNLSDHQEVFSNLLHLSEVILEASELIVSALNKNGKIIFCGNGGSASDSQHLAAEFVGRFNKDRISLPAISLTSDSAVVTAIANDYGYEKVFSRQLEGLGLSNDVIFCISTSGNSKNILEVLKKAKDMSIKSILLSSEKIIETKNLADLTILVPSESTARIQEAHIFIGQTICEIVESKIID